MESLIFVKLDSKYCGYLRQFDKKELRLFIGVLFEVNDYKYFAPWLNRNDDKLYGRSKKLYDKYLNGTLNQSIAKRCCNFKLLEEKCIEYNELN